MEQIIERGGFVSESIAYEREGDISCYNPRLVSRGEMERDLRDSEKLFLFVGEYYSIIWEFAHGLVDAAGLSTGTSCKYPFISMTFAFPE